MKKLKILKNKIDKIKYGRNCRIVMPCNLYQCEIKNDVFVGPFVEIQKGAIIGNNSKISSHTFICELVTIGDNCFVGHGVMFTNDLFKNGKTGGTKKNWYPTNIGNNVLIGSNSTLLPVTVCDNVVIGAGSVVTKDIFKPGIYAGNPAKFIRSIRSNNIKKKS